MFSRQYPIYFILKRGKGETKYFSEYFYFYYFLKTLHSLFPSRFAIVFSAGDSGFIA
ncbi:hypothetical protein GYO_0929 [Bacillus spizizenii TU-B-10]|uniref:Uncharacterized protein n=1 Tax=Bacillus spizizenii (strain DSM 15029 / JCM 12233 / NBRC 101239 / NRRL B-23049 / TU-B-10) TaxID=1052585 RepID=G4NUA6_BACS4|nr:hypothetical protein GYO_0929 [Bacillus spizizenii TU-B-10]